MTAVARRTDTERHEIVTITPMQIPRGPFDLAALLHLPDDADPARPVPAVVLSTPGSSVKEQIGANYASRLQLAPNPIDLMIVEGAGHYEMYDVPDYVDQAVERLADFYHQHLPADGA